MKRLARWPLPPLAAAFVAVVAFAASSAPSDAMADATPDATRRVTKDQCVDANTQAQALRRGGRFSAARERLRFCLDAACPGIVRDDCARRLDELEGAQPTIVFEAKDSAGGDVSAVTVTVDGQPFADGLTGVALAVDPGEHTFGFQVAGQPPVSRRIVLHEAEKSRRERVVVGGSSPEVATAPASAPFPEAAPLTSGASASAWHDRRMPGFVVGGIGVAGILVGSAFGLVAIAQDADASCQADHHCANPQKELNALSAATVSTIAFSAGGVLLAAGIVWVVLSPRSHATSTALVVTPTLGLDHGGVSGVMMRGAW